MFWLLRNLQVISPLISSKIFVRFIEYLIVMLMCFGYYVIYKLYPLSLQIKLQMNDGTNVYRSKTDVCQGYEEINSVT